MLSLSSHLGFKAASASPAQAPDTCAAPTGEACFSALLDALAGDAVSVPPATDLSAEPILAPAIPGMVLPPPGVSGKGLPVGLVSAVLPADAADEEAGAVEIVASASPAAEMLPAQLVPPPLAPSAIASQPQQIVAEASEDSAPRAPEWRGNQPVASEPKLDVRPRAADKAVSITVDAAPPSPSAGTIAAEAQVDAGGHGHGGGAGAEDKPAGRSNRFFTGEERQAAPHEDKLAARIAEAITRAPAESPIAARNGEAHASPLGNSPTPTMGATFAPAASPEPVQEIAALIDRLAAAREALVSTSAAVQLDHAEFGPMTLRFEQQESGQLDVGISARDAEAQRAVTAALAAERGTFINNDRSAAEQQPASSRAGTGQGLERGAMGSGSGGNQPGQGHARHDQSHDNRPQRTLNPTHDRKGGGVYA